MRNKLLVAILSLTFFSLHSSNVKFYNINSLSGISMRKTTTVCKDKNGFIWTSSMTGVLRITRDDYRTYQLPYENNDIINTRLLYSSFGLLAYSNNGQLFRYNEIKDRFDLVVSMSKVLHNKYLSVSEILVDNIGDYWIASTFGLYRYREGRISLIADSKPAGYLAWYDSSSFFVSMSDGIWLFDIKTSKTKCLYRFSNYESFLDVTRFYYDSGLRELWIGTLSKGLYCYDLNRGSIYHIQSDIIPKQPILAIKSISDSTILIGIDGQGLWELNKRSFKILNIYKEDVNNPSSLYGNGVYDIFSDHNKRIWVSTYSGGVSFFEQASPVVDQISHIINNNNSLGNNNVNKVIQDKIGNIWFATDNGISCKEFGTGRWKNFYQNQRSQTPVFLSLCEDDKGRIWAGSYSSGIYVLDEHTGRELAHYSMGISGFQFRTNFVLDIFKDSQGDIWIGGVQGDLLCYLSKENKFRKYSGQAIYAFEELSPNKILLCCTYGLRLLDKKSGEASTLLDGYLVEDVISINDDIWICTGGEGLIRYNQKTHNINKITTLNGLPSNYINSIMYADGYLWLGTETGLCRLDPKNMGVLTYNTIYPLSRVSFNRSSSFKLRDGQLIWGTSNGAVRLSPKLLTSSLSKGAIFFQNLFLAGLSIRGGLSAPLDSLQKLSVKYNQNTIHLELLSIGNISGAKFSWIFEGLDNNWSQPTSNNIVNYSNIPSGKYMLKIRLYDSSLSRIIAERSLKISIVPPYWRSWWFILLMLALLVAIFYLSIYYYIERLKQQHAQEKVRIFTNTAHDIRTSVTLIKAPIEELAKEPNLSDTGKYYLSLAVEQIRRLAETVTQLMDFQKVDLKKEHFTLNVVDLVGLIEYRRLMFESYAKKQRVDIFFTANLNYYQTAVDESMVEKIIDNLISNAIKYSHPDSQVQIIFKGEPDSWILEVKDNGIGVSKKAQNKLFSEFYRGENAINSKVVGSGIGLLLVKNYVDMHDGKISCVSEENVGTTFKVEIPYKVISEQDVTIEEELKESDSYVDIDVNSFPLVEQDEFSKEEMRILVVEDNDDLRNFIQYPLQADFEVLLAADGVEAWEIVQKEMPDLIVSDVMMPKMDGFEFCRLVKSTYETSHIPLILLTALSGTAEQLQGLGLGADDYLTKPFNMALLAQRIKSIIKNRNIVSEKALKLMKSTDDTKMQIFANSNNDDFVKKMLDVVNMNMTNTEFGKENFAAGMNVSTSLLYKKVKSLTGQSPTDFIKTVRLNHALELLQSHNYRVTEVSELCGFSSIGYFSTVFKKHYGKSPNEV